MNAADALKSVDPQAEALAKISSLSPDTVRTSLAVLIAALIELGSGLGFWLLVPTDAPKNEEPAKAGERQPVKRPGLVLRHGSSLPKPP
jgi:hypothetical protein